MNCATWRSKKLLAFGVPGRVAGGTSADMLLDVFSETAEPAGGRTRYNYLTKMSTDNFPYER